MHLQSSVLCPNFETLQIIFKRQTLAERNIDHFHMAQIKTYFLNRQQDQLVGLQIFNQSETSNLKLIIH